MKHEILTELQALSDEDQLTTEQEVRQLLDQQANIVLPQDVALDHSEALELELDDNMEDSVLVQEINNYLDLGINSNLGEQELNITKPLNYYYSNLPGLTKSQEKDLNSSRFVSSDIAMSIDSTIAELNNLFQVEEIAMFTPDNEKDEMQAQQETQLINNIFFNEFNGALLLQRALKDCLLHRNAVARVAWEEMKTVEYEEYENVNPIMLQQLQQPQKPDEEVRITEVTISKETNIEMMPGVQNIQPFESTMSVKLKRISSAGKPIIEIVKPEDIIINSEHEDPTLEDARFVAYKHKILQSDLIALGYDEEVVDNLKEYHGDTNSYARDRDSNSTTTYSNINKTVLVYECFLQIDYDNDGIAELRKVVIADDIILSNEPVQNKELVSGCTKISPHKWAGISMYDDLRKIQDSKTFIMRSIIDGTRLSANTRIGVVTDTVNIDDLLTSRTGGIVRMTNPNGIVQIPNAEVPQSAYQFIEFMDSIRRDLGAASIDTAQTAAQTVGATATAVALTMGAVEAQSLVLAKTFAATFIRSLFIELHAVIKANHPGQITKRLNGTWLSSTPSEWRSRPNVVVTLGGSKTEKQNKAMAYQNSIQYLNSLKQEGSVMYNDEKMYHALTASASLSGIRDANELYIDPRSEEGQQIKQQNDQQQNESKQKQDALDQLMAKAQSDLGTAETMKGQASLSKAQSSFQVDQMQAQLDAIQTGKQLQFDYEKLRMDTAIELAKIESKEGMDVDKIVNDNYQALKQSMFNIGEQL